MCPRRISDVQRAALRASVSMKLRRRPSGSAVALRRSALAANYAMFAAALVRFGEAIVGNGYAEDIVQDAYLSVLERRSVRLAKVGSLVMALVRYRALDKLESLSGELPLSAADKENAA
jgi:DNA-directed RNA polymerase specialized sigma24 family protein